MTTKIPVELSSTPGIVDGSNATAITIDSSENVGIGTSSPSALLHLSDADPIIKFTDTAGGDDFGIFASASDFLGFFNFSDSRTDMVINGSGNVGIGTTSPSSPNSIDRFLHIHDADHSSIVLSDDQNTWEIVSNNTFTIRDGTDTRLNIDPSGQVGIGTTSPSAPLHIVGDGNTGQRVHVGTSSAHQIYLGNTGGVSSVGTLSSHDFQVITNGASRVLVSTTNGVGIGTAIDHAYTSYDSLEIGYAMSLTANGGGNDCQIGNNFYLDDAGNWSYKHSAEATLLSMGAGNQIFYRAASGTADAHITWLETMRTSSGNLLLGTTASGVGTARYTIYNDASNIAQILVNANGTANGTPVLRLYHYEANSSTLATQIQFLNRSGIQVGYITSTGSATAYNTSSDYRLKENVRPIENGLDRLNSLNPVKFDWKKDGTSSEGFIAHEVQEIFSDAISGEKDGEDMQGMDYGRITPLLVKAIQEQQEQIEQLKTEIQTLKGE